MFELILLDNKGDYFDCVGEYDSLKAARDARDMYIMENPDERYSIYKVSRDFIE